MTNTSSAAFSGINLACGGKLCRETGWINADHSPSTPEVRKINLLKPLPFPNGSFDVVYHSQFIEHLPADMATTFTRECFRILKPNGVLRIVTPDLQNQAAEYLKNLQNVLASPDDQATRLRYEWIRLEMLDQLARQVTGGDMVGFLRVFGKNIRDYLIQRMGRSGENLIPVPEENAGASFAKVLARAVKKWFTAAIDGVSPISFRVGRFSLSGESHLCMYDEYLLGRHLAASGFVNIARVGAKVSRIPNWDKTLLDCDVQGKPDCEVSLFMECVKPA